MNRAIMTDLKRQLLTDMEELVRRRLAQAEVVLSSGECAVLFLEAAAALVSVAQLYTLSRGRDEVDLSVLFDMTEASAGDIIRKAKPTVVNAAEIVRTAAATRRGERPERVL